jgi:FkbM family methyltransferase
MRFLLSKFFYIFQILRFSLFVKNKYEYYFFIIKVLFYKRSLLLISLVSNQKFIVRNFYDIVVIQEVFQDNIYEDLILDVNKSNSTYIDIGGYIGDTVTYFAEKNIFKKLIVFEPMSENMIYLKKNLLLNNLNNKITLFQKAVVENNDKTMNFFLDNNFGKSGFFKNNTSKKSIKVETISFSEILKKNDNVYLKIDCEGAEFELFSKLNKKYFKKIRLIVMEYHKKYYDLDILLDIIKKNGFEVSIKPHTIENDIGLVIAKNVRN